MIVEQRKSTFLAIIFLIVAVLAISWSSKIDDVVHEQINESIVEASVIWALSRSINKIVSVVQETEVAIPIWDNIKIKPLEILDPVNDAIERFGKYTILLLFNIKSIR